VRAEAPHELALGDVGVLVLVEEDVAKALREPVEDLRLFVEELDRQRDLVAEVERVSLALELPIGLDRGCAASPRSGRAPSR
jgi:hypothetical protein